MLNIKTCCKLLMLEIILFALVNITMQFRLVHWNIQKFCKNTKNYFLHIDQICKVLQFLKPDILNLCEVSDIDELNYIKKKVNSNFNSYFLEVNDGSFQNLGLITRFTPDCDKLLQTSQHFSKSYSTYFNIGNTNFSLISAHLCAYPLNKKRGDIRELQAHEIKKSVDLEIAKGKDVIITGDLNDFDQEHLDKNSNIPITNVLKKLKGNVLLNIAKKLPQDKRYTYIHKEKNYCKIDHVLVTPRMFNTILNVDIYHCKNRTKYDSDHDPIIIDFKK